MLLIQTSLIQLVEEHIFARITNESATNNDDDGDDLGFVGRMPETFALALYPLPAASDARFIKIAQTSGQGYGNSPWPYRDVIVVLKFFVVTFSKNLSQGA
jgi:hypothetical protein